MKREEQIKAFAESLGYKDGSFGYDLIVKAVLWADSHTGWISVKDELPKHDTEENGLVSFPIVLVCLYDGYRTTSYYDDMGDEWGDYDGEVEYWMPLPTAPKKED